MTKRRSARLLPMTSLREVSTSSAGAMPARANSGRASSRTRPLARARVTMDESTIARRELDSTGLASPGPQSRIAAVRRKPVEPRPYPLRQTQPERLAEEVVASIAAGFADAPDPCPQGGELFLDSLVAAIEMVDAIDGRASLRHQTRDHEAGGGPQIGRHHVCRGEPAHALDDGS